MVHPFPFKRLAKAAVVISVFCAAAVLVLITLDPRFIPMWSEDTPSKANGGDEIVREAVNWRTVVSPGVGAAWAQDGDEPDSLKQAAEGATQQAATAPGKGPETMDNTTPTQGQARRDQAETLPANVVCASDWRRISRTSLDIMEHRIDQGRFAITKDCRQALLRKTPASPVRWFVQNCASPEVITVANRSACIAGATHLRAYAIGMSMDPTADYSDVSTAVLANLLTLNFLDREHLDKERLQQNIAIADEITTRDPDVYGAYKAKLVSMLMLEAKFNTRVADDEFDETLSELADFDTVDPTFSLREESLALQIEERLAGLREELESSYFQSQVVEGNLAALEEDVRQQVRNRIQARQGVGEAEAFEQEDFEEAQPVTDEAEAVGEGVEGPELQARVDAALAQELDDAGLELTEQAALLAKEQAELEAEIEELEAALEAGPLDEDQASDVDLARIPFLRLMVRGDYGQLMADAEDFTDQNPESPIGYFFLAQGLWRTGRQAEALATVATAMEEDAGNELLLRFFRQSASKNPAQFIEDLQVNLNGGSVEE